MTRRKFQTVDLNILGTTVHNSVAMATRHPGFVHLSYFHIHI